MDGHKKPMYYLQVISVWMSGSYFLQKVEEKSPNSIRILLTGVAEIASARDQIAK